MVTLPPARRRRGLFQVPAVLGLCLGLILAAPARAADDSLGPYEDEQQAFELLYDLKTPGARLHLAWIRHDYAIRLIDRYSQSGDEADLRAGLAYARSAAELAPDRAAFWRVLAMGALVDPRDPVTRLMAEDALIRLLELAPEDREARRLLADLQMGTGHPEDAVPQYLLLMDTLFSDVPDFDMIRLVVACLEAEMETVCERRLDAALDRRPGYTEARIGLAILLRARGQERQARSKLETVQMDAMARREVRDLARHLLSEWERMGTAGGRMAWGEVWP